MTIWKTARLNRVVVTGMGVISPLGNSIGRFWDNITAGTSGVGLISRFDTANFKTKFAAEVRDFEGLDYFDKKDLRKYDLFTQYAVAAAQEAVTNACLEFNQLDRNRIGLIWGSGNGGIQTFQEQIVEFVNNNGKPVFSPFFIPKIIADIPSGIISIRYGLRGLNFSTISACASSNNAIIDAYHLTGTHPDGEGAFLGMMDAMVEADISADAVDYVNAHATSTLLGDMSELKALDRVFGHKPDLSISSTKSMTGHLLGAAGAVESIVSILSVKENIVPATINTQTLVKEYADHFDFVLGHAKTKEVNIVMNNTFGFGGHIATILFQKYNP